MLFYKFKIYMHLKKISVFLPLFFGFYLKIYILRITKIGLNCFFEPVNIFDAIIGILLIVNMKKLIPVFLVFDHISIGIGNWNCKKETCEQ